MKDYCTWRGINPVWDLEHGMDFRHPRYRREVFMRFYDFHLKYRAHPGAVYYVFPELFRRLDMTQEQKLWFVYINGCSQNVITTYFIFREFPELEKLDVSKLRDFWEKNATRMGWDTDRRYVRTKFPDMVQNYIDVTGREQSEFFDKHVICLSDVRQNFISMWDTIMSQFNYFGRLATFSYMEYLRIAGVNVDCDRLFLDDISGSKSHRNGVMKVAGRDDKDWTNRRHVEYGADEIQFATEYAADLLAEATLRFSHEDVSYFTLESTLCCYKSWHRRSRRYPNVYNDMFCERIKYAAKKWGDDKDLDMFWEIRKECLPKRLRLEDNPMDLGLHPIKQNHYLNTGEAIMMDGDWDCFRNEYNDAINLCQNPPKLR